MTAVIPPRCAADSEPACDALCPKSATARFGCKQRKAGNGIGAAQRATADAEARGPSRACMPAPTCVWVDSQTEPFEGRGETKRTSDSIDDIGSNPERPEILDESCRRRNELSPPLTSLSTFERKHNSTSCALWSLPRIFFFFCAPVGGGPAHKSVCNLHADACPTHPDLPASVCQCACSYVVLFPRMLAGLNGRRAEVEGGKGRP